MKYRVCLQLAWLGLGIFAALMPMMARVEGVVNPELGTLPQFLTLGAIPSILSLFESWSPLTISGRRAKIAWWNAAGAVLGIFLGILVLTNPGDCWTALQGTVIVGLQVFGSIALGSYAKLREEARFPQI